MAPVEELKTASARWTGIGTADGSSSTTGLKRSADWNKWMNTRCLRAIPSGVAHALWLSAKVRQLSALYPVKQWLTAAANKVNFRQGAEQKMSKLRQAIEGKEFVVTGEIGPPKGVNLDKCLQDAEMLRNHVTAINVTDLQSAVLRIGSLAVSGKLVERHLEPIYQLTCRDRNRLALQSDLLSAWALGIENVLCLTGDHPIMGDHTEAKPVYDLDSVQLLKTASTLNQGYDMAGHELEGTPDFFLGAVVTPGAEPLEPQIIKMRKKIEAGARFFQTQAVYELEKFKYLMDQVQKYNVPVIAGMVVLKSASMAKFMNSNVAGINVPESIVREMEETKKDDRKKKSVEITARIIREVKPLCQGVHIMPLGWDELVPDIINEAGLSQEIRIQREA
jgi:methylenetetrahydrofolate reductase (NADPH)